ncbi:fibronectin type III domain-containing protein [Paenibacillus sp. 481]|uniref:fibronectin type III domain-containing protein n=1 Tax=Paenibacillus sp. 481 TaxID=2835869 RepID=UPI001E362051|nr:fibronectin type III domain-containing protein [Paenibacillus sp. 481]UHA73967.1 fibronectin type III domain-containing protein [Paenibacillus sp. 481]
MLERKKKKTKKAVVALMLTVLMLLALPITSAWATQATYVSQDGSLILVKDQRGDYIVNGSQISSGQQMSWSRAFSNSWRGGSISRSQTVSFIGDRSYVSKVEFGEYTSPHAGQIKNAVRLKVEEVHYMYNERSYSQSGMEVGQWQSSTTDVTGQSTPRHTNYSDPAAYFIVNADTGSVVDFDSELNYYYGNDIEGRKGIFTPALNEIKPVDTAPPVVEEPALFDTKIQLKWSLVPFAESYDIDVNGSVENSISRSRMISGLQPNTEYQVKIRAKNRLGEGTWSKVNTYKTKMLTPTVQGSSTTNSVSLNWNAVPDAQSYEVDANGTIVNIGNATTYTADSLPTNTNFTYKVKAKGVDNESNWTNPIVISTFFPKVTGVTSTPLFNTVDFKWDALKGASAYDIEVDGVVKSSPTTNQYKLTGLTPNQELSIRVKAKSGKIDGEWSDPIKVKTLLATPVAKTTSASSEITVAWADIVGATSYEIEADGVVQTVNGPSYTHTGLTPASTHKYKVRAKNDTNESTWSTVITANTVPAGTGTVTGKATSNSVVLNWTAVPGATKYEVERNGVVVQTVTGVTTTQSGLQPNTDYTIRVRANNTGGVGEWSAPIKVKTLLVTPVATATSTSTDVTVTWPAIADAASYEIDADGVVHVVNDTSYMHTGLVPASSHTYKVRAKTDSNASDWSKPVTRFTVPTVVTNVTAGATTFNTISVSWPAVTGATSGYDIEYNGKLIGSSAVTYVLRSLTPDTDYTIRVRAKNAGGTGEWSTPITAKTQLPTPVAKAAATSPNEVALTWAEVPGATSYDVDADGIVHHVKGASYSHIGLIPSSAHTYKVRAKSDTNEGAWSAAITAHSLPAAAEQAKGTATSTTIVLSWPAVPGTTRYEVERDGVLAATVSTPASTLSSLQPNMDYVIRVRAKNTGGNGEWSQPITVKTLLATPVATATSTSTEVTITWPAVTGATSYEVEADGSVQIVNGPSYTHTGLTPASSHTYKVRAKSDNNVSDWSKPVTRFTVPAAVTNVAAGLLTFNSVNLTWVAAPSATSGYEVEYNGKTIAASTTPYVLRSLTPDADYTIRVRAKNAGGAGEWSEPIMAKTQLTTPVPKATSTIPNEITLAWAEIPGATSYEVEVDGVIQTVNSASYTHTGLAPASAHKYKVRAKSTVNEGAWSTLITAHSVPTGTGVVTGKATSNSIVLTWTAVPGATKYEIERNGAIAQSATGVTATLGSLTPNKDYTIRVRANNTGGFGEWSQPITVKTLLTTPVTTVKSTSTEVTVTWVAIADATAYEVEADGVVHVVNSPSYTHANLAPASSHMYKVRAKNDNNVSDWSKPITHFTVPETVATAVAGAVTFNSVHLTWNAVPGATGYDVEFNGKLVSPSKSPYLLGSLAPNTDYTIRVRSKNTGGVGEWSAPIMVKTQLPTPTAKAVSTSTSEITVTWAAIPGATSYEIDVDGVIQAAAGNSYTHTGLTPASAHTYKVRAKNDSNEGAWSAAITTHTLPSVTGQVTGTATSNTIALSWPAVPGAARYEVERDGAVVSTVTTVSTTVSSLQPNKDYTIRVRAKNTSGNGEWSAPVTIKTLLPTPVATAVSKTSNEITVTWPAIVGATSYEVEADGVVQVVMGNSYTHTDLNPASSHTYKVRAKSDNNVSDWSKPVTRITVPGVVTNVAGIATLNSINVTWTAVAGAASYEMEYSGKVVKTSSATYNLKGLVANTDYTIRVRAINASGIGEWSTPLIIATVLLPQGPAIDSITPDATFISENVTAAINGKNFASGVKVLFGDVQVASTFVSANQINITMSAWNKEEAVDVTVINPTNQKSTLAKGFKFKLGPAPTITEMTPNTGLLEGGNLVSIRGSNFSIASKVYVNGIEASTTFTSAGELQVRIPATTMPGAADIKVVNGNGQEAHLMAAYTYIADPPKPALVITEVTPNKGPLAGGNIIVIKGMNFNDTSKVSFNGVDVPTTYVDPTQLEVSVPVGTVAGPVEVRVTNGDGQVSILMHGYEYEQPVLPVPAMINMEPEKVELPKSIEENSVEPSTPTEVKSVEPTTLTEVNSVDPSAPFDVKVEPVVADII